MTQMSLRQPSLDLSPGSSSPILEDDEISVILRTPPRGRTNTSRNLLPIFSSSTGPRETLLGPSVSTEDLVNQLPGWYDSDGYNSSLSTPSSVTSGRRSSLGKRSYTPATTGSSSGSPGSSVSSADNCKLFYISSILGSSLKSHHSKMNMDQIVGPVRAIWQSCDLVTAPGSWWGGVKRVGQVYINVVSVRFAMIGLQT